MKKIIQETGNKEAAEEAGNYFSLNRVAGVLSYAALVLIFLELFFGRGTSSLLMENANKIIGYEVASFVSFFWIGLAINNAKNNPKKIFPLVILFLVFSFFALLFSLFGLIGFIYLCFFTVRRALKISWRFLFAIPIFLVTAFLAIVYSSFFCQKTIEYCTGNMAICCPTGFAVWGIVYFFLLLLLELSTPEQIRKCVLCIAKLFNFFKKKVTRPHA